MFVTCVTSGGSHNRRVVVVVVEGGRCRLTEGGGVGCEVGSTRWVCKGRGVWQECSGSKSKRGGVPGGERATQRVEVLGGWGWRRQQLMGVRCRWRWN
jgi:hypothetical protein